MDHLPAKYPERERLTGWYDDTTPLVRAQTADAHKAGVDFFIFDWYERTPGELRAFVAQAVEYERAHPTMRVLGRQPLIFVEAWNELGEGSYVMPTRGDGGAYARALRAGLRQVRPVPPPPANP